MNAIEAPQKPSIAAQRKQNAKYNNKRIGSKK